MAGWTNEHAELAEHLVAVVERRLIDPLEILLGTSPQLRQALLAESHRWAVDLLGEDQQAATYTAIRLVASLYPSDQPFDPPSGWWRTPLGQVVARRIGIPGADSVPVTVAAAMLGITRQGVHDLIIRGKLDRHPAGGVATASVSRRLNLTRSASPNPVMEPQ